MIYAGIGARATPNNILEKMQAIAQLLSLYGWTLRSGGAVGADKAFEAGCRSVDGKMVVRVSSYWQTAMDHAAQYHPAWHACDEFARSRHARNSLIMLGDTLDTPVRMVVCWTDGGGIVGGTGQALRIAAAHGIPVFNLWNDPSAADMWTFVNSVRA